jgi:hypothetical protein
MAIANVSMYSTYQELVTTINQSLTLLNGKLIYLTSNNAALTVTANVAAGGNVYINAITSVDQSDTSTVNLAPIGVVRSVSVNAKAAFDYANGVYTNTAASFAKANLAATAVNAKAAFDLANLAGTAINTKAAFDKANTATADLSPPFLVANAAYGAANSVFGVANLAATATNAKAAFDYANGVYTNTAAAFLKANGAATNANESFDYANGIATNTTAAFAKANQSTSIAITDDTSGSTVLYPSLSKVTTGTVSTINTSSTKLTFDPSTGTLSATVMNTLSDKKLKEKISKINGALDTVLAMRGVSFQWKETKNKSYGLIAQELEKQVPELVGDANGTKTVNYDAIIAFLIEAIRELNDKIEAQNVRQ